MEKVFFVVDIDRCWGCKSCQTACKVEHGLPAGALWPIEVVRVEEVGEDGTARCNFVPVLCQHCDTPACLAACPVRAIAKGEDGLVQVDRDVCIGCGLCQKACSYGAVKIEQLGPGKKAVKCDLCAERRGRGFLSSCEQHCMGEAFTACDEAKKMKLLEEKRYHWSTGQVVYVSDTRPALGRGEP